MDNICLSPGQLSPDFPFHGEFTKCTISGNANVRTRHAESEVNSFGGCALFTYTSEPDGSGGGGGTGMNSDGDGAKRVRTGQPVRESFAYCVRMCRINIDLSNIYLHIIHMRVH